MIKNRYFLLSEFFRRDALNLDEGAEIYFYTILFSNEARSVCMSRV